MLNKFDYIVIGAGPGGTDAALTIRAHNYSVAIIEVDKWGGTCLHQGCIPTKALLHLSRQPFNGDLPGLFTKVFDKVAAISSNLVANLTKQGVTLIQGFAHIIDAHHVRVDDQVYETNQIVYATGSRPINLSIPGIDNPRIFNSETIYHLTTMPKKLAILGGGYIGFEWANIFNNLGVEVTIYEALPQVLGGFDDDVKRRLLSLLRGRPLKILTNTSVQAFEQTTDAVVVKTAQGAETYDCVLLAVGRRASQEILPPGIIKVGDAKGAPFLAHKASADGKRLFDEDQTPFVIPSAMFTDPEIAVTGSSEKQLQERQIPYVTSKTPYRANSKALVIDQDEGFVKLILNDTRTLLLGAVIIGYDASNIINVLTLAIEAEIPISKLKRLVFPHPTIGEIISQALDAINI